VPVVGFGRGNNATLDFGYNLSVLLLKLSFEFRVRRVGVADGFLHLWVGVSQRCVFKVK
jgi:hypothetical protein